MSYSNDLLIYSNTNLHESYISDETAANIVSYMNDNDFFEMPHGPLYYWLLKDQHYPWKHNCRDYIDLGDHRALSFGPNDDVSFTLEADVREMSYLFPDLIFELTTHYLGDDEYTKFYYKNGKVKTAPGEVEVTYPDFDYLEWEDAK